MKILKHRYVEIRSYIERKIKDLDYELKVLNKKAKGYESNYSDELILLNSELQLLKDILYVVKMSDWQRRIKNKRKK